MHPRQQKLSLKNRALRFLSLREHSRLELKRKLARYAEEGDDVEALLDLLEKLKFLSSERFSESLVRRRLDSYGNHRILAELQTHGLDPQLLAQNKAELAETEIARARAIWQKKFGHLKSENLPDLPNYPNDSNYSNSSDSANTSDPADPTISTNPGDSASHSKFINSRESPEQRLKEQKAKQIRFLAQRGFSSAAIKAALRGEFDEIDDIDEIDQID